MLVLRIILTVIGSIIVHFVLFGGSSVIVGEPIYQFSLLLSWSLLAGCIVLTRYIWKWLGLLFNGNMLTKADNKKLNEIKVRIKKLKQNISFLEKSSADDVVIAQNRHNLEIVENEYCSFVNRFIIKDYEIYRKKLFSMDIRKFDIARETKRFNSLKKRLIIACYGKYNETTERLYICKMLNDDFANWSEGLVKIQNDLIMGKLTDEDLYNRINMIRRFMDYSDEGKKSWGCIKCHSIISCYPCKCCGTDGKE